MSIPEATAVYDSPEGLDCTLGTDTVGGVVATAPLPQTEYYAPFFRYEPILPPDIHGPRQDGKFECETARPDRIVVTSDGWGHTQISEAERELTAPRVDLDTVIRCGQFDEPGARARAPRELKLPDPWANRMVFGVYRLPDSQNQSQLLQRSADSP